jgi:integrase/recombinase XerD
MIKCLSDEEYMILVSKLPGISPRNAAMVALMVFCGLRNGEVCNFNIGDVSLGSEIFSTIGIRNGHSKKKSIRFVPVNPTCSSYLAAWLKIRRGLPGGRSDSAPLFITEKGKGRISARDVQRICRRLSMDIFRQNVHPHALRHTFATRLLRVSNVRIVQQLLGHTSLNSTMVYTHPTADDQRLAVMNAF